MLTGSWWRRETLRAGVSRVGIAVYGVHSRIGDRRVREQNPMAEPKGKVQVVSNDRGVVINNAAASYCISEVPKMYQVFTHLTHKFHQEHGVE